MLAAAGSADTNGHTVQPGETLSGIAAHEGSTVQAIAAANGISDPNLIIAGMLLVIPAAPAAAPPPAAPVTYTVQSGDNLAGLATRFGTTPAAIVQANGIKNPNVIVIGKVLQIPSGAGDVGATGSLPARLRSHPERLALRPTFVRWANAYGVPPSLLEGLAWNESGWQNDVVSSTGALGIGQLMPDTVTFARLFLGNRNLDPANPDDNIRMSAWFLGYLLQQTGGNGDLSVAAYYQGLRSVTTGPLLAETQHYVEVVKALRPLFA
ncbi:MAG: hypothetical protein QOE63_226 [Acidimicrobiaceae bacterium]